MAIGELISALQPAQTTLVLATRRQDRVLELDYADEQLADGDVEFETRLADLAATRLDYVELVNRLATLSGADRVEVQPPKHWEQIGTISSGCCSASPVWPARSTCQRCLRHRPIRCRPRAGWPSPAR